MENKVTVKIYGQEYTIAGDKPEEKPAACGSACGAFKE